mgnify:CR=1 FL=1
MESPFRKTQNIFLPEKLRFLNRKEQLPCREKITPDELVDAEIARLRNTEAVKMAEKEMRLIYRKRKYLAQLRWMEKRGKQLIADGWTLDTLELLFKDIPEE